MNLNLSNLSELIERVDSQIEEAVAPEKKEEVVVKPKTKMEQFRDIAKGVARKYSSKWVDGEDLEQELWIKILELMADAGGEENLDAALVAKACFRKAVDYYRYCRRRYEANISYIPESFDGEGGETSTEEDYSKLYKTHGIVRDTDYTMMTEVVDLFPEGSKEREYVIMKLRYYGELDPEYWQKEVNLPKEGTAKDGDYREVDFLSMIGYNGKKISGSWIVKKNKMREEVEKYLRS